MNAVEPAGRQRLTVGERGTDHRDGDCGAVREQRAHDQPFAGRVVALVEDDHRLGSGVLGVDRLDPEGARAPLDQGDVRVAGEVGGEVGGLAPAGDGIPGKHQVDVDRDHVSGDLSRARSGERTGLVDGVDRGQLLQGRRRDERERELVQLHAPSCRLQPVDHVVDAGVVPRRTGGTGAAVGVGDPLECVLVGADLVEPHALEKLLVRVVVAIVAGGLRRRRRSGGGRQQHHHQRGHRAQCCEATSPIPSIPGWHRCLLPRIGRGAGSVDMSPDTPYGLEPGDAEPCPGPRPPLQQLIRSLAPAGVDAGPAVDDVDAQAADQCVGPGLAPEPVAAGTADDAVAAGLPVEIVATGTAVDVIGAGVSVDVVRTGTPTDEVIAAPAVDVVGAAQPMDDIATRSPLEDVGAGAAHHRHRRPVALHEPAVVVEPVHQLVRHQRDAGRVEMAEVEAEQAGGERAGDRARVDPQVGDTPGDRGQSRGEGIRPDAGADMTASVLVDRRHVHRDVRVSRADLVHHLGEQHVRVVVVVRPQAQHDPSRLVAVARSRGVVPTPGGGMAGDVGVTPHIEGQPTHRVVRHLVDLRGGQVSPDVLGGVRAPDDTERARREGRCRRSGIGTSGAHRDEEDDQQQRPHHRAGDGSDADDPEMGAPRHAVDPMGSPSPAHHRAGDTARPTSPGRAGRRRIGLQQHRAASDHDTRTLKSSGRDGRRRGRWRLRRGRSASGPRARCRPGRPATSSAARSG